MSHTPVVSAHPQGDNLSQNSSEAAPGLDRFESWVQRIAQTISFAGVAGMLLVAAITCVDIAIRWTASTSISGLNEVIAMTFAVAIAATLPAGAAMRINLKVDLLTALVGAEMRRGMDLVGSLMLAGFFTVLAQQLFGYAASMVERDRVTTTLGLPVGHFMYGVAFFVTLAAIIQVVYFALDVLRFRNRPTTDALETASPSRPLQAVVLTFAAAVVGLSIFLLANSTIAGAWVNSNLTLSLVIAFAILWFLMLAMVPVGVAMAFVGVAGCVLMMGTKPALSVFGSEAVGFLTNSQVAALPLFLLMGSFATTGGLADDVYRLAQALLARYRGGLSLATIGGCAGFGAVTGSSLATTATFGRLAIPQMRARGYAPSLATGCVAAGGTLGALIPPSAPIILFALLTETSIGALFVGAVVPGLVAVAFYLITVVLMVRLKPSLVPAATGRQVGERRAAIKQSGPVLLLFATVLGGLYGGVFTATEAAAVGAIFAFIIALARGKLNRHVFWKVMGETTALTAMIYGLIFGALAFSFFVTLSEVPDVLISYIGGLDMAPLAIIALILVVYLLLGSVMDSFAVMVITVPVVTPLVLSLGYDMVWWGIVMLVVVETGLITPPFGINLFVMKSMQPDVPLVTIFRGAMPFVLADLVKLILIVLFPVVVLWLPASM